LTKEWWEEECPGSGRALEDLINYLWDGATSPYDVTPSDAAFAPGLLDLLYAHRSG
jgi:hypothetical protein